MPDGEVKTAQSHSQDSKPHQFFVSFSICAPAVNYLLVTEDTASEKGARYQVAISHFIPSPSPGESDRDQSGPSISQVERESRFRVAFPLKFGALTEPHPPNQGEGSISLPHPSIAGISSAAMQTTSPSY